MVSGAAPRIAPDVSAYPVYAAVAAASAFPVAAYVGTPIVSPNGELFGTVCGYDQEPQSLTDLRPLLDLLSSLLSAVLAGDLHATRTAQELEQARRDAERDPLTGLLNRRGWDRYLEHEEERYRRFGGPGLRRRHRPRPSQGGQRLVRARRGRPIHPACRRGARRDRRRG
jgi:hypothetical protein